MKKYFLTIVVFSMLFLSVGDRYTSAQTTFKDVNSQFWAQSQINHLANNHIIGGYPDGTFRPNNSITRGQAAKMLVKALKLGTAHRPAPTFKDISKKHDAYTAIAAIADEGLMSGTNSFFLPDETLSRAQMAAILTRAFNLKEGSSYMTFKDVSKKHWAYENVRMISSNRITGGYSDGTFRPGQPTTRAQFSVFLAVNLYPDKFDPRLPDKVTQEANEGVTYYGDWVYYNGKRKGTKGEGLYREKIDGSQVESIAKDKIDKFDIENNQIYYTSDGGLYKMDLNGKNRLRMKPPETNLSLLEVEGKWVYLTKVSYLTPPNGLYRMNMETNETVLLRRGDIPTYAATEKGIYLYGTNAENEFYPITNTKVDTDFVKEIISVTKEITPTNMEEYIFKIGKVFADRGELYYTLETFKPEGTDIASQKRSYFFVKYNETSKKSTVLRNDEIVPFNMYDGYLYVVMSESTRTNIYKTPISGGPLEFVASVPEYYISSCWNNPYKLGGFSIIRGDVYFYEIPGWTMYNGCDY